MRRLSNIAAVIFLVMVITLMPFNTQAKVDWEVAGAIQLDEIPIDIAHSSEGDLTFLLTDKAKVLIYSSEGEQVGTVPVDSSVTDIAVSAQGDKLYLINSKRRTMQTVEVDFIVDINVSDSPFLGPAGARVAVVVFSDFQ